FENIGLAAVEALLDAARLTSGRGEKVKVEHVAPGTIGNMEVAFFERREGKGIVAVGAELELAILSGDSGEFVGFAIPVDAGQRIHLSGSERDGRSLC